jgi:hypothetical protein
MDLLPSFPDAIKRAQQPRPMLIVSQSRDPGQYRCGGRHLSEVALRLRSHLTLPGWSVLSARNMNVNFADP